MFNIDLELGTITLANLDVSNCVIQEELDRALDILRQHQQLMRHQEWQADANSAQAWRNFRKMEGKFRKAMRVQKYYARRHDAIATEYEHLRERHNKFVREVAEQVHSLVALRDEVAVAYRHALASSGE